MTKFMNEAKYLKASSVIYHDFRVAKAKVGSLKAGSNSVNTAI
jgi:hydroxymethylglutaryl-CoA reductase